MKTVELISIPVTDQKKSAASLREPKQQKYCILNDA